MADLLSGIYSNGFKALLKLNIILAWRPPKSEKVSSTIGSIVFIFVFAFLGLVLFAVGIALSMKLNEHIELVRLVSWGGGALFLVFLFMSLFQDGMGGDNDPSLIFHAPLSATQILLAELLSRVIGPLTIPSLAFFTGCAIGMALNGWALMALLSIVGAGLWLFQFFLVLTVADYLLFNLRRSRRFTELVMVLFMFLVVGAMALNVWVNGGHHNGNADAFMRHLTSQLGALWPIIESIVFYLPGLSSVAWISGGGNGAGILLAGLIETSLLLIAGRVLLKRIMESGGVTQSRRRKGKYVRARTGGGLLLPSLPFWPFTAKELKYMIRDPHLKMMALNVVMMPIFLLLVFSSNTHSRFSIGFLEYGLPLFFLMYMGPFVFNSLAIERDGLMSLVTAPFKRWKIFTGKNFLFLCFYIVLLIPLTVALSYRGTKLPVLIADWACYIPLALIFLGAGNLVSIFMPIPMIPVGKRLRPNLPKGKMWLFTMMRTALHGILIGFALPLLLGRAAIVATSNNLWISIPLCSAMLMYGVILYAVQLTVASRIMPSREPSVFELIVRIQGG